MSPKEKNDNLNENNQNNRNQCLRAITSRIKKKILNWILVIQCLSLINKIDPKKIEEIIYDRT